MILRSVIRHVRDQNWVAVWIDFLIVVVGVFIGIQVADWNEARKERETEVAILERLQTEVDSLIDVQRREMEINRERAARMVSSHGVLFGQEPLRALTTVECEGIAGSHIYRRPSDDLPILDELRESGRFDLLGDQAIKSSLRNYLLLRERARGRYAESNNDLFRLYSRHPGVLRLERIPLEEDYEGAWTFLSAEGFRWNAVCDAGAMRESHAFLNDFVDNSGRMSSQILMYEERIEALEAVRAALQESSSSRLGE